MVFDILIAHYKGGCKMASISQKKNDIFTPTESPFRMLHFRIYDVVLKTELSDQTAGSAPLVV